MTTTITETTNTRIVPGTRTIAQIAPYAMPLILPDRARHDELFGLTTRLFAEYVHRGAHIQPIHIPPRELADLFCYSQAHIRRTTRRLVQRGYLCPVARPSARGGRGRAYSIVHQTAFPAIGGAA